jgi:DNA gyrase subunit A
MQIIPGPDFPTSAIINGVRGIREAYRTGRGRIYVRARAAVETDAKSGRQSIIVTELPYQVNKARLLEKIAELVKLKRIEGITELRDESDKRGMRMVIELRRGEVGEVVLNNLYQHTQLQSVFGINMVALVQNQPRLFNLKELLEEFLRHRREVVIRRSLYDLRKARERAHILEGLAVALSNIDPIIALIKAAANPADAKEQLIARAWPPGVVADMLERAGAASSRPENLESIYGLTDAGYRLSPAQAQAILDLRLHRLTGLEQEKIRSEYAEILARIDDLLEILRSPERLVAVIREELMDIRERFGDARKTEIVRDQVDLTTEDLIAEEDVVVTLSHAGYVKAQPLTEYRAQRRGGRGKTATRMKDEDFVDRLFVANTHDTLLCFSSRGKVYWLKVYQLPLAGRSARGRPIVNLLALQPDEKVNAVLAIRDFADGQYVFMCTSDGRVKKTALADFSRPRTNGIIAVDLREGSRLVDVDVTDGGRDVILFTDAGKLVRFSETEVRAMGRTAGGVRGITLKPGQSVISQIIADPAADNGYKVLTATAMGYGKRTPLTDCPRHRRGGQGVIAIQVNERNGRMVGAELVSDEDEVMLITTAGTLIRTRVDEISVQGRNTQGVRLIVLGDDEHLAGVERVAESD